MNELRSDPSKLVVFYPQYTLARGGKGDFATAMALAEEFVVRGGLSADQIVLASNEGKLFAFFNRRNFRVIDPSELENLGARIGLIVVCPLLLHEIPPHAVPTRAPILGLAEYDCPVKEWSAPMRKWTRVETLGLGDSSIGIFIDRELAQWADSPEAQHPSARLRPLSDIPPALQEAVLPFAQTKALYAGYCHTPELQVAFLNALRALNPSQRIAVVFPNADPNLFADQPGVEILKYDRLKGLLTTVKEASDQKIRLIVGAIDPAHFKEIQKVAEKETIVTGDSSLSQAISLGKNFLYEVLDHKDDLGRAIDRHYPRCQRTLIADRAYDSETVELLFRRNQTLVLLQELQTARARIFNEWDAGPKIDTLVSHLFRSYATAQLPLPYRSQSPTPDAIAFDQPLLIDLDTLLALRLETSGKSHLPEFGDSTFCSDRLDGDSWLLIRQKKGSVAQNDADEKEEPLWAPDRFARATPSQIRPPSESRPLDLRPLSELAADQPQAQAFQHWPPPCQPLLPTEPPPRQGVCRQLARFLCGSRK